MKRVTIQLLYCLAVAFALLAVCSRSSFLYVFNNWDDANSYFTVGKSMMRGMVPYRDLFDQKGVLLYFVYGLASLISYRSFGGVFLMEIIAACANLLAMYRLLLLYVRKGFAIVTLPFIGACIYSTRAMWWGGSAEEFLLPFLSWSLYISILYFKKTYPEPVPYLTMLTGGILAGCVFLIKFNSLGFYIGWVIMMIYAYLLGYRAVIGRLRRVQLTLYGLMYFLLGFLIPVIPFAIYFLVKKGLYDWFYVYIYCNLFIYSNPMTLPERIYRVAKVLYNHIGHNPMMFSLLIAGGVYWLVRKGAKPAEKVNVLVMGFFLVLGIFIGGVDLPYYPLPLSVFSILGILLVTEISQREFDRYRDMKMRREETELLTLRHVLTGASVAVFIALSGAICYTQSLNIPYLKVTKEEAWQFDYAARIEESGIEKPTLLNVRCFDAGLYTSAGILPNCRFFQTQTIHLDEVWETQHEFIKEGRTDFVLSRDEKEPDGILDHYTLIAEREEHLPDFDHTYYLYMLNEKQ